MNDLRRLTETPAGVRIGALADIADGASRNFVLEMKAGRFHGFVVRRGHGVFGYLDSCPHAGVPLTQELDAYLTPDRGYIQCRWHGALFEIPDGVCVAGPCKGARLKAWPVAVRGGEIFTA